MSRLSLSWLRILLGLLAGVFLWLMWQSTTVTSPELESLKLRYGLSQLLFGARGGSLHPELTVVTNWRGLLPLAILFGVIFSIMHPLQRFIALVAGMVLATAAAVYCFETFKLVVPLGGPAVVLCCSYLCGTLIHLETEKIERNRNLAIDLQLNAEDERKRIAKDLHDESLPALQRVVRLTDKLSSTPDGSISESIRNELEQSISGMRRIIDDLHPSVLEEFGLVVSLEHLLTQFGRRTAIAATLKSEGCGVANDAFVELCVYRILQESLNNIEKHANATAVTVTLERSDKQLRLNVSDNGSGEIKKKIGSHGLTNMEHRAKLIGGTLKWGSLSTREPGNFVVLTVRTENVAGKKDTACRS